MSIRTSLRAIRLPGRSFATSATRLAETTPPPTTETPAESGFAALASLFQTPPAPASSAFQPHVPPPLTSLSRSELRGYLPHALPPKIDPTLDLFTNLLMKHGKKAEAQGMVSRILSLLQNATNSPPLPLLHQAFTQCSPSIRMVSIKQGSKSVQSPRGLNERQRLRQGIMWMLKCAERGRKSGAKREDRIAREILAVLEGTSEVFKRIEEVHRAGMVNRSQLHSR
ncbi:small subunit ribosomal protein S7, partial [Tremellales sp. Uapishka_1]